MRNSFVRIALIVYGLAAGAGGILIVWVMHAPSVLLPPPSRLPLHLAVGVLAAIPVEVLSVHLFRRSANTRDLAREIRGLMGSIGTVGIAVTALASGIGEEIAFRGVLQTVLTTPLGPILAILITSIVFGALHIPPKPRLAGWMLFAGLMGVYLGVIFMITGSIVAPALTHALINFINLHVVARRQPVTRWFTGGAP